MDRITAAYEQLIEGFIRWAQAEDNVRAAFVIGSRARRDHPADEWSDLDVIILADDPRPYVSTTGWLAHIGHPWLTFIESTPEGDAFEQRVLFEGGLDVDFVPSSVGQFRKMLSEGLPPADAEMVRRGIRVLVDKDGLSERLAPVAAEPVEPALVGEPEYLNLVSDFWYHTVWTAKKLRRGELWTAKSCCDVYLKQRLLRMLEWHTRAVRGPDTDTWMRGRFLEEWADPRALQALPAIYAHHEEEDVWRALEGTMELFRWLAIETGESLGYGYPSNGDDRATELVRRYFSDRNQPGCGKGRTTRDG
ncbi:MAG: aminoglycoside 6-adenylyltransferase [Anaerolineae bacterium]|nr:aminoglycoside 6-adenylyltransferase [Anaerolineae bacterium]